MLFRDRDRSVHLLYWDIPPRDTDSLKLAYLISTKGNVFTVTNSLGMFTVLAKAYQFLVTDVAAFVSGHSDILLLLSISVHSYQTHSLLSPEPPHSNVLSIAAKFTVLTIVRSVHYHVNSVNDK